MVGEATADAPLSVPVAVEDGLEYEHYALVFRLIPDLSGNNELNTIWQESRTSFLCVSTRRRMLATSDDGSFRRMYTEVLQTAIVGHRKHASTSADALLLLALGCLFTMLVFLSWGTLSAVCRSTASWRKTCDEDIGVEDAQGPLPHTIQALP